ncbi:TPA: hypothetical protein RQK89_001243 [Vibrio vulnificus]|uniref:hypothetical protein n=1 Tax=Vibrio vulnificus TaxID=672 RepID=UPI001A201D9F|nr:hypothetical protein [Vibrio vulnificus]EGQ9883692.1 hypothetical protein [Vibrio vulnificus]EGR0047926.1 hypothetical protein [Vibrio vulnificus]EJQ9992622.1 hypothetical protein [Vibrio vulnificus]MCA3990352.1 hypothetical protein [Vibrio vulnificus]HAS8222960.1 hypothetical protein [Vibrio vulnificus]
MNYINSDNKNGLWELAIKGIEGPILASDYLGLYGSTPDEARTASIKKKIVVHSAEGEDFIQCGYCGLPVRYRARSATSRAAFYHKHIPELDEVDCPFHSDYHGDFAFTEAEMHETQWHFRTKHFIAGTLRESDQIKRDSIQVEKFVFAEKGTSKKWRKPDIYFEDTNGNRFAIELIQGWLDPEIIHAREQFFLGEEINLIWLFSEGRSDSIFYYIMYGTALEAHPESFAEFESKVKDIQCNAFVFSQEALDKSQESGEFYFEAHFPEFDFKSTELFLEMSYGCQMVVLSDLILSPERLPYAINTKAALHGKQQELSAAIQEKAQRESRQSVKRIYQVLDQIASCGEKAELSSLSLTHLSDEINDCFDYVLQEYDERSSLLELTRQTIARERTRLEERQRKAERIVHAKELRGLRHQIVYVRRVLNQGVTVQELTDLRYHLADVMSDYWNVISSDLSSLIWRRYLNILLEKIGAQTTSLAKDLPKPVAIWRITNDLLSYPLEKRMQLFEVHSPLGIEMSNQLSAYSVNKSPQETQELKNKLDEIKRRTKVQFLNKNWKALMGNWDPEYSYLETFLQAGDLLCIEEPSELIGHEQDWVEEALNMFVERLVVLINEHYNKAFIKAYSRVDADALGKLLNFWDWLNDGLYIYNQPEAVNRAHQLKQYLLHNDTSAIEWK